MMQKKYKANHLDETGMSTTQTIEIEKKNSKSRKPSHL